MTQSDTPLFLLYSRRLLLSLAYRVPSDPLVSGRVILVLCYHGRSNPIRSLSGSDCETTLGGAGSRSSNDRRRRPRRYLRETIPLDFLVLACRKTSKKNELASRALEGVLAVPELERAAAARRRVVPVLLAVRTGHRAVRRDRGLAGRRHELVRGRAEAGPRPRSPVATVAGRVAAAAAGRGRRGPGRAGGAAAVLPGRLSLPTRHMVCDFSLIYLKLR